jgi:hypothetical protein
MLQGHDSDSWPATPSGNIARDEGRAPHGALNAPAGVVLASPIVPTAHVRWEQMLPTPPAGRGDSQGGLKQVNYQRIWLHGARTIQPSLPKN